MAITIRRARDEDHDRIFHLARQAFPIQESDRAQARERFKPDRVAVVEDDGRIVAQALEHRMGHWFGGRAVDSIGIAGVAVSPDARGKGYGTQVVRWLLDEAAGRGTPVSALYPATIPIYRALGYGDAFHRVEYKATLAALPHRIPTGVEIREMTAGDIGEVAAAYDAFASRSGGLATRSPEWWQERVLSDQVAFRYLAFERGRLSGWLFYSFAKHPNDWRQDLVARDLIWTTRSTAQALLEVAALHRSTCVELRWIGPPDEPLYGVMHDHAIEPDGGFRAMLRLLDVPAALRARGYAPTIDAELSLAVLDPKRPGNEGPWRVSVEKGNATVEPASTEADATVTVETLASVFSGLLLARDAERLGGLRATPAGVDALESMFAGPTPWLADFF